MIMVKLMGGLGNQMFQYAAARCLALRHNTPLKLDLSFLEGDQTGNTPRRFALDCFAISAAKASPLETALMSGRGGSRCGSIVCSVLQKLLGNVMYHERFFQFDPEVLRLPGKVYLEGYWQSEHYFAECAGTIRQEFTVQQPLRGRNRELADEIRSVNAVSVHVRRGDYVRDATTNAAHGVCGAEYYTKAIEIVTQYANDTVFFVFSDEPEWVAEHLKVDFPVRYISHNGDTPHEDLRLMSLCRHHIIANSSFSWWGAWLSDNPDKIVIAPKRWFNDPSINTSDLTPTVWQRI